MAVDNVSDKLMAAVDAAVTAGRETAAAARLVSKDKKRGPYKGTKNLGRFDFRVQGALHLEEPRTALQAAPLFLPTTVNKMVYKVILQGQEWIAYVHFDYRIKYNTVLRIFREQGAYMCISSQYADYEKSIVQNWIEIKHE